jgi:hypothetical protein
LPSDQNPAKGINLPFVDPTNFPGESFWWSIGAEVNFPAGGLARLVLVLETAIAVGVSAFNEPMSFGCIRLIIDAPMNGTYTVRHA